MYGVGTDWVQSDTAWVIVTGRHRVRSGYGVGMELWGGGDNIAFNGCRMHF